MFRDRKVHSSAIETNNRTFTFIKPHDPEELVEEVFKEGLNEDEFLPYWADIWPSSEIAIKRLPDLIGSTSLEICEIGSGLGDFACILASYGHKVIATDYAEEGCHFAKENANRNSLPLEVIAFDWRNPVFKKEFDVVVGVDILYELRWIDVVLNTLKILLKPEGKAFILDPNRQFLTSFINAVPNHGLRISQTIDDKTKAGVDVKIIEICRED